MLAYLWPLLALAVLVEAGVDLSGVGWSSGSAGVWLQNVIVGCAAVLTVFGAMTHPRTRSAWLAFGLATFAWFAGNVAWSALYGGDVARAPEPTIADVFWLLWYPLAAFGIYKLIRINFEHFEIHRWMDGLAVMVLVLAVGIAVVVQPVADHTRQSELATVVDFSYPVLDLLLGGAVLGVYGLLGWRPHRIWVFVGIGILATTIADAVYSVHYAHTGVAASSTYDFVWSLGALALAYAAWIPRAAEKVRPRVTGFRAIILPLVAQAFAAGIQIYAFFKPIGTTERLVTVGVLAIASVQIILTRPRAAAGSEATPDLGAVPQRSNPEHEDVSAAG
jgi:diguanylate cyclase